MAKPTTWGFPSEFQPRQDEVRFDLEAALDSVVLLRAEIPENAFTASILGTERFGNAVAIRDDGLVLTVGYLITEATSVWLTTRAGAVVPAHALAYDQATGFGLALPLGRLEVPAMERGTVAHVAEGDDVLVIGHGGRAHSLKAQVVARHEFAGSWEYLIDDALFTAPAHPQWGGTALVGEDGQLLGIGSLLVQERDALGGQADQGNMFIPIDALEPILDDLLRLGRRAGPARPWLGIYAIEAQGSVGVSGLAEGGPADRAGVREGDLLIEVGNERVSGLADLFRKVWRLGPAGVEVPLTLSRKGALAHVRVRSIDRTDLLAKPKLH